MTKKNIGTITQVLGAVVDVRFERICRPSCRP